MTRVLIVEPSESLRNDLACAVRRAGYEPEPASDTAEALVRLAAAPVELVLADVAAPSSLAELSRLRSATPGTPVVAMGRNPSVEVAVEAMKRGAGDFLRKPFAVASLEAALAAADRSSRADHPGQAGRRSEILTADSALERLLREASAAAATDATIQIVGESGTGKDLLARHVHRQSRRRSGPFVAVSCAALPESLAECELFGHEQGAFTGASQARIGQIAAAEGGTLLLDEVAAMEPWLQPKLLRVIQEREILPVGGVHPRRVDVRIVATTQRELGQEVEAGRFREDLYYRLDVIVLRIPPLRERPADLPLLAEAFLARFAEASGCEAPELTAEAFERLARHPFRGNVRELENLMRRAVFMFPGRELDVELLLDPGRAAFTPARPAETLNLKQLEYETIVRALRDFEGNRTHTASALGISVRTLRNKIRLYALT